MNRFLLFLTLFFSIIQVFSQNTDKILAKAYLLYNSEKASWNGTDIFLEMFPEKRDLIGGYLSYPHNNNFNCIFFNQDSIPIVLATINFDSSFKAGNAIVNTHQRRLTLYENELLQIRKKALIEINSDTLFKFYKNTSLNPIPIIFNNKKMVYVLTGPQISNVVIFGNDYLLTFDKKNNVKTKKCLHKNILTFEYNNESKDAVTMHSHLKSTGDLITATDICTLLLYENYAQWKQHYVISENNVSIWDCSKDDLIVLTRKAWDRINEHQKDKHN